MSSFRALLGVVQGGLHFPARKREQVEQVEQVEMLACLDDKFKKNLLSSTCEEPLAEGWETLGGR